MSQHVVPSLQNTGQANQTCSTCRHFEPGQVIGGFGSQQVTTPGMCAKLGKPVDLTIMTREQAEAAHALTGSNCSYYNSPGQVSAPPMAQIRVGFPIHDADHADTSSYYQNKVTTCTGCKFFIEYDRIKGKGLIPGWAMCSAKGNLLNPRELDNIAQSCDKRQPFGYDDTAVSVTPQSMLDDFMFIPGLDIGTVEAYGLPEHAVISTLPEGYDPMTYTSPVSAATAAKGIKGMVTLTDPSGTGNTVKFPVFRRDFFSNEDQELIPSTDDDEHPEDYVDYMHNLWDVMVAWLELDMSPSLWGAPGIGKTELARYLAWLMQLPLVRINITDSSELDDLEGYTVYENNETKFKYGRVPRAWQRPCVLLLDEPNVGPRAVWQFLRPIMDDSKMLSIDAASGEPLPRHDFCFLMLAMNPAWDMRNEGTNDLADADVRRMYHIDMDYPDIETEELIIRKRLAGIDGWEPPKPLMDKILTIGNGLRAMSVDLPITWGLGQQIKVARLLRWFPAVHAYKRAAGSYLDPDLRERFLNEVRITFEAGV